MKREKTSRSEETEVRTEKKKKNRKRRKKMFDKIEFPN